MSPACFLLPDGRRVSIEKSVASLGGDPACDVVVEGPGVKASHALVFRDGAGWRITSSGGALRVNGRRVEAHPLAPGDVVTLGKAELRFEPPPGLPVAGPEGPGTGWAAQLSSFASRLLAHRPAHELLAAALEGVAEVSGADLGFAVTGEPGERRILAATQPVPDGMVADGLVDRVLTSRAPVLVSDVAADAALAHAPSLLALRIASALAVPLPAPGGPLAALYLGRRPGRTPFSPQDLEAAVGLSSLAALLIGASRELSELRLEVAGLTRRIASATFEGMIGDSPPMRELYRKIERISPTPLNVLVLGETGTGKELVARALHRRSGRRGAFVALSCGAIPEGLIERELFGHVRGAFSGAVASVPGVFEAADGGTLFLDEIGDMPISLQSRLLRVVQEREVTRLGDTRPRKVDVRLVAASHRNLRAAVKAGQFREDLLFRLDEVGLEVPPLRERGEDVLLIAHHLLGGFPGRARGLTQKAAEMLRGYPFPGNVRELVAVLRRAAAFARGDLIGPEDLALGGEGAPLQPLEEARDAFVRRYVREAIARCGGNKREAAEALGIGLRSLFRYLEP